MGDKPDINELEVKRYFYGGTATAPLGDMTNAVGCSTFLEEQIATLDQEKYRFSVYSFGNGEISDIGWAENKERDRYLELGLESFDIYDNKC